MRDAEESRLETKKRITHIGVVLTEPFSGLKSCCTSIEPARAHERHNLEIAIRALVMSDISLYYYDTNEERSYQDWTLFRCREEG